MMVMGLSAQALIVAVAAWLGWSMLKSTGDLIETWLGWMVTGITLVVGSAVVLGYVGGLSEAGFVSALSILLLILAAVRRSRLTDDLAALRKLVLDTIRAANTDRITRVSVGALVLFLCTTGTLALLAEPVVYDALTYRLSRIGHWLQEGAMDHITTNDPRQNYMPTVPDLLMAWLLAGSAEGWRPAALVQWGGGVLLLLGTIGLGRQLGLSRLPAIGAALLCAGLANVAPQFTTVHTDLFTAGLVTAAFFLWRAAGTRGQGSISAGLAAGLAIGAKGTVFYLLPTLLLWTCWYGWRQRLTAPAWTRTAVAAGLALLVFAAPGLGRNWSHYGNVFGPPEFVALHHQGGGMDMPKKTALNLATTFAQNLEPHSQPPGLDSLTQGLGRTFAGFLPEADAFAYESLNRRQTILGLMERKTPDADATVFGVLLPLTGMLALGAAITRRRRRGATEVGVLSGGIALFLVFFHAMQQWHPYGFRYFVLIAPWLAVIAVWGITELPRIGRITAWSLLLTSAVLVSGHTLTQTHQAGWQAVVQPERSRGYFVSSTWANWVREFDQPESPLGVAMPFNRPLAAFYRNGSDRTVQPVATDDLNGLTAEQASGLLGGGWLIVPANQFLGNEGNTIGRTWLFRGEPTSPFSLAAYRRPKENELRRPFLYRETRQREHDRDRREILVHTGDTSRLRLIFTADENWHYSAASPLEQKSGDWPGGTYEIELKVPTRQVAEIIVWFSRPDGSPDSSAGPLLEIHP